MLFPQKNPLKLFAKKCGVCGCALNHLRVTVQLKAIVERKSLSGEFESIYNLPKIYREVFCEKCYKAFLDVLTNFNNK